MSFTLKEIIQDIYKQRTLGFADIKGRTISSDAAHILTSLYEQHKNGNLSPESVIFIETTNSINHIISILKKLDLTDLDTAIREELELIYSSSQVTNKKVTLNSVIQVIVSDLGGISHINQLNKGNVLSRISEFILEARVYGDLDEDTNKVIKQPDHMDLLSELIDQIILTKDIFKSIKALYLNVLSREHDFLDEVARENDISEVKKMVALSESRIHESIEKMKEEFDMKLKLLMKAQFNEVHKHLNLIGQNVHTIGQNLLESSSDDSESDDSHVSHESHMKKHTKKDHRIEDEIRSRSMETKRHIRNDRNDRNDRNERNERDERGNRNERSDRNERNERGDRNERNERNERIASLSREALLSRDRRATDLSVLSTSRHR